MHPKKPNVQRSFLCPDLLDQLDPRNHLLFLAKTIAWQVFEDNFRLLYALKQLENLNDERVVGAWDQKLYFQAFCGQQHFAWQLPCDSPELTYFRRRIGEDGVHKIFEISVALPRNKAKETEVVVGSQCRKRITSPTDALSQNYSYQYNDAGNIREKSTEHGPYVYSYDGVDRLIAANNPTLAADGFTHDAVRNRFSSTAVTGNWLCNENNELSHF